MEILRTSGLKQIILLILIAFIGIVLIWQLKYFIPGVLGAITLYILLRNSFFKLTILKRWPKWIAAIVLIVACALAFGIPVWILYELLKPKFSFAIEHSNEFLEQGKLLLAKIQRTFPQLRLNSQRIEMMLTEGVTIGGKFLNATANILLNTLTALFILYFMLLEGREMERRIMRFLPLRDENKDALWAETKNMVVSNSIGIPILILCQCIVAALGYWLFNIPQALFWGILTGIASIIPMVGTMIVWIPICIVLLAGGDVGKGLGLFLYCGAIVSNIDNVLRFTIMKRIGDVHPLITVFGVIVGLQLFGIMGLIFGPLLLVYFILLIKIYRLEFSSKALKENDIL